MSTDEFFYSTVANALDVKRDYVRVSETRVNDCERKLRMAIPNDLSELNAKTLIESAHTLWDELEKHLILPVDAKSLCDKVVPDLLQEDLPRVHKLGDLLFTDVRSILARCSTPEEREAYTDTLIASARDLSEITQKIFPPSNGDYLSASFDF